MVVSGERGVGRGGTSLAGGDWRGIGKERRERVSMDKLDTSFTALCWKKEQRSGAGAQEQYGVKGGLLFLR